MNVKTIRWVIVLGIIAFASVIISQVFWIRKGLTINQSNFESAISITLEKIAAKIETNNHGKKITDHPVVRISPHTYLVDISEKIDLNKLDYYLRNEFANPFHKVDFNYQVYEKDYDLLVFEETVSSKDANQTIIYPTNLPVLAESTYYFTVNFPQRPIVNSVMLFVWITSLIALTVVIVFFGYSLDVILRQQRLSRFQKDFINNLAHEFKTPISTIKISADDLTEPDIAEDPERIKNYAAIIQNENNRLTTQVGKILELAKLENDDVLYKVEPIHINEVVATIVHSFDMKLAETNGKIIIDAGAKNDLIHADRVHFENAIYTLIDNALKYNDKIPFIRVATSRDHKHLHLSVADNGIGIPKKYRRKIFEKFFRVPTGDIHNVKGFGLGLSYVKMVGKAHKWKLHVSSEINKGSIFTIIFPNK